MQHFKGYKIVELASVLAGPAVGMFFSELGADVVKVENKLTQGDVTRSWRLPGETKHVSAYYSAINFNKESVMIDFTNPDELKWVHDKLKSADVVISNFKKGDDIKFQLDYQTLKKLNPALVLCEISGFESNEERVAYDVVIQAETGYMSMNGTPDSGPLKMPVALMDILAANQAKEGVLTALLNRHKTGKGARVKVSLEKSGLASLVNQASNFLMNNYTPRATGSLHPNIAPYGEVFSCKDGKGVVLAIGSDKQFKSLCALLKLDPPESFVNNQMRVLNRTSLYGFLEVGFHRFKREKLMKKALKKNIPLGAIKSMEEVFDSSVAQGMIRTESIEGEETKRISTIGFDIEY